MFGGLRVQGFGLNPKPETLNPKIRIVVGYHPFFFGGGGGGWEGFRSLVKA